MSPILEGRWDDEPAIEKPSWSGLKLRYEHVRASSPSTTVAPAQSPIPPFGINLRPKRILARAPSKGTEPVRASPNQPSSFPLERAEEEPIKFFSLLRRIFFSLAEILLEEGFELGTSLEGSFEFLSLLGVFEVESSNHTPARGTLINFNYIHVYIIERISGNINWE